MSEHRVLSGSNLTAESSLPRSLRPTDLLGVVYLALASYLLLKFHPQMEPHPYLSSFIKFAVLASFGECLRGRLVTGSWYRPLLLVRAFIWGIFGIWIAAAYVIFNSGEQVLADHGLWLQFWHPFWVAAWLNLSGFGPFLMLSHYLIDRWLDGKREWPWQAMGDPHFKDWARTIIISIVVFWIPAQTIVFSIPETWRVLLAAYLSVALGILLALATTHRRNPSELAE